MGAWGVASGMMLRDMLRKGELEEERLKYEEDLDYVEKEFLERAYSLGYMSSMDRAGYLRAMSKARQTFKGLNPKDKYLGMIKYDKEKKDYYLNPDFVYVVEDFYFEMKRGVSREEYARQKYEYAKREFIERFENDPKALVNYSKEKFGINKKELFARVKRDELVCCAKTREKMWVVLGVDEYKEEAKRGNVVELYPLLEVDF